MFYKLLNLFRFNTLMAKKEASRKDCEDVDLGGNAVLQRERKVLKPRKKDEAQAKLDYTRAALAHLSSEMGQPVVTKLPLQRSRSTRPQKRPTLAELVAKEEENEMRKLMKSPLLYLHNQLYQMMFLMWMILRSNTKTSQQL